MWFIDGSAYNNAVKITMDVLLLASFFHTGITSPFAKIVHARS